MRRILGRYNVYILLLTVMFIVFFFASNSILVKNPKENEVNSMTYRMDELYHHAAADKIFGTYSKLSVTLFDQSIDETGIILLLLCIKNILTLFCKLIVILSLAQFYLYIIGWIIMVSQITNNYFLLHYLRLKDGKKCAIFNQISFSF